MHITEKARKVLLIVLAASLFLAVLAFARNVKTMFMYMNAQNVMFLLADSAQVVLYAWVWSKCYFKTAFTKLEAIIATVLFILSSIMNTYLFVQNFWWLESEGWRVFYFWLVQNGSGVILPVFIYFVIKNFQQKAKGEIK